MILEACTCGDLPAHDHFMGHRLKDGVLSPWWDEYDIGRIWVPWKEVAKALIKDA